MQDNMQDIPGVIAPPPLIYAGTLAVGLLLHLAFPVRLLPRSLARFLFGGLLSGMAVFFGRSAFQEMRRARTNVSPFEPVTALVVEGPFRFTRNPIYLSLTLLYGGIAILANAFWALLLLPVVLMVMRRGVIEREEQYLERKFGQEYLHYKQRVRRWL